MAATAAISTLPPLSPLPPRVAVTASLACLECRRKHLRCDGAFPRCRRCDAACQPCHYTPSRRGRKRRHDGAWAASASTSAAESVAVSVAVSTPSPSAAWAPDDSAANTNSTWALDAASPAPSEPDLLRALHLGFDAVYSPGPLPPPPPLPSTDGWMVPAGEDHSSANAHRHDPRAHADTAVPHGDALVGLYYAHFHACHPLLVPRHLYCPQRYPRVLQLAVRFVGSHYTAGAAAVADTLRPQLVALLGLGQDESARSNPSTSSRRETAHTVQALVLFAIAAHARHELLDSEAAMERAVQLALALGMHRRAFAASVASADVEQESMRRTWWELYVVDGYLAALHHKAGLRTAGVESDVPLPWEEADYAARPAAAAGASTHRPALSLAQLDGRVFAEHELPFSSASYRIDAVRLLAKTLSLVRSPATAATTADDDEEAEAVDHALAGWPHHLRAGKHDVVDARGTLDELLFQAHVLVAYAAMVLHCPHSGLVATLPTAAQITCSGAGGSGSDGDTNGAAAADSVVHAVKAVDAACHVARLAALCSTPGRRPHASVHTPFFVCGLLLAATVQLADCVTHPAHRLQHRERVRFAIGLLRSLGRAWPLAGNALRLIRRVAGEVLESSGRERGGQEASGHGDLPADDQRLTASFHEQSLVSDDRWVLPLMLDMDEQLQSELP